MTSKILLDRLAERDRSTRAPCLRLGLVGAGVELALVRDRIDAEVMTFGDRHEVRDQLVPPFEQARAGELVQRFHVGTDVLIGVDELQALPHPPPPVPHGFGRSASQDEREEYTDLPRGTIALQACK